MIQWFIGNALSFLLGDLIGPGLVVVIFMALAVICILRGYKTLAYASVAAAILLGSFLIGAQMEKKNCTARIQKMLDVRQAAEDAEKARQATANAELAKLRDKNFKLTSDAAKLRSEGNAQTVRGIRTQIFEKCSSAHWSVPEFERVRQSARPRRVRGGN